MLKQIYWKPFLAALLVLSWSYSVFGQNFSRGVTASYRVSSNVTYVKSGGWEGKLDIYSRTPATNAQPTVIWFHGGDSFSGSKDGQLFSLMPYMEMGWNVVNVEYISQGATLAPTALQNSLCAVRWVIHNARQYGFDSTKLVISGASSGGWFATTAGLNVRPDNWDQQCPGTEEPKVAAIVDWYGCWDLADILDGPNKKPYAADWVRTYPNPMEIARIMSPLPLRKDVPPVISIHGDADPTVPYTQSVRLQQALKAAGVTGELITIPGGKHGGFSRDENQRAFTAIEAFLAAQNIRRQ